MRFDRFFQCMSNFFTGKWNRFFNCCCKTQENSQLLIDAPISSHSFGSNGFVNTDNSSHDIE